MAGLPLATIRGDGDTWIMSIPRTLDLDLPTSDLARAIAAAVVGTEHAALANHSYRTFIFARLLAANVDAVAGQDYDEELLFAACMLHDIGLTPAADGNQRFEVDGADHAAAFLQQHGLGSDAAQGVWDAIALHTSGGIAERRSLLCKLTRGGVGIDLGPGVGYISSAQASAITDAYPRLEVASVLTDAIVHQIERTPAKGPRYSIGDVLRHERMAPPHVSRMEQRPGTAKWGA